MTGVAPHPLAWTPIRYPVVRASLAGAAACGAIPAPHHRGNDPDRSGLDRETWPRLITESHARPRTSPAFVAQGIEHRSPKAGVAGSNPAGGTAYCAAELGFPLRGGALFGPGPLVRGRLSERRASGRRVDLPDIAYRISPNGFSTVRHGPRVGILRVVGIGLRDRQFRLGEQARARVRVDSYRATASALNSPEQSFIAIGGLPASSGSSRSSISVSTTQGRPPRLAQDRQQHDPLSRRQPVRNAYAKPSWASGCACSDRAALQHGREGGSPAQRKLLHRAQSGSAPSVSDSASAIRRRRGPESNPMAVSKP